MVRFLCLASLPDAVRSSSRPCENVVSKLVTYQWLEHGLHCRITHTYPVETHCSSTKTTATPPTSPSSSSASSSFLSSSSLRASAMLKHVIDIGLTSVCPSVRPSVRPPHAGALSKRLNIILSCFLHHTIAHSF